MGARQHHRQGVTVLFATRTSDWLLLLEGSSKSKITRFVHGVRVR